LTKEKREQLDATLYADAERRRIEHERLKEQIDKERLNPKGGKYYNDKSDKYILNKFVKEMSQVQLELADNSDNDDHKQSEEGRLYSNDEFIAILIRLGFLPNSHPNEFALVRGNDGGVSLDTLRVVLLNIIGIKTADREKVPEEEGEKDEAEREG
jgi:hypothetical protein